MFIKNFNDFLISKVTREASKRARLVILDKNYLKSTFGLSDSAIFKVNSSLAAIKNSTLVPGRYILVKSQEDVNKIDKILNSFATSNLTSLLSTPSSKVTGSTILDSLSSQYTINTTFINGYINEVYSNTDIKEFVGASSKSDAATLLKFEVILPTNATDIFEKELDRISFEFLSDLHNSPKILDEVEAELDNAFDGTPNKRTKSKYSKKVKIKPKVKVTQLRNKKGQFSGNINLREVLNRKLHDQIQSNMGESNEPPIRLRYQTGRFARSAKVLDITRTRETSLNIFYTYMRYPYDTFLPPLGRQSSPQRDPQKIISKSIREIATEFLLGRFRIRISAR